MPVLLQALLSRNPKIFRDKSTSVHCKCFSTLVSSLKCAAGVFSSHISRSKDDRAFLPTTQRGSVGFRRGHDRTRLRTTSNSNSSLASFGFDSFYFITSLATTDLHLLVFLRCIVMQCVLL